MRVLTFLFLLLLPGLATAQQPRIYVQIEAHPSLEVAQERARAYAGIIDDVNGFALSGNWYGLSLGPYTEAQARQVLRDLRLSGLVPRDSYVTLGETYRERFWPAGLGDTPPAGDALVTVAPIAPDTAPAIVVQPQPDPEETLREAQRSERALTREQKQDLQRALQWFGFYTAAIDGSYGRGTRSSMAAWQRDAGLEATGVLTTRQRARLLDDWRSAQAALGLAPVTVAEAGIELTAPTGLVRFDRIEAPFVHYEEKAGSGMTLSLISQAGDVAALGGLYEILQALDVVPVDGPRSKGRDSFRIEGREPGRSTQAFAKLEGDHILGYILSWPDARAVDAARSLEEMEVTLRSTGAPLPPDVGFDAAAQSIDMVSGLELRQPLRSASGFFVDRAGAVLTSADTVAGCGRVTLDRLHDAEIALARDGVAVLRPTGRLAPVEVAVLAPGEGRLRSQVSVGGFPYGGVLGAATLSFGTLEDVRGLDGGADALRLSLQARDGDVGGPVLDAGGRVAGMLLPDPVEDGRALPGDVAFAVKARALLDVLSDAGVSAATSDVGSALAPEDLALRATGMTVLVSCWP